VIIAVNTTAYMPCSFCHGNKMVRYSVEWYNSHIDSEVCIGLRNLGLWTIKKQEIFSHSRGKTKLRKKSFSTATGNRKTELGNISVRELYQQLKLRVAEECDHAPCALKHLVNLLPN
jgi:hypothetical protein